MRYLIPLVLLALLLFAMTSCKREPAYRQLAGSYEPLADSLGLEPTAGLYPWIIDTTRLAFWKDRVPAWQNRWATVDCRETKQPGRCRQYKADIAKRSRLLERLQNDPSIYNLGGLLHQTLHEPAYSNEEKISRVQAILATANAYYAAAKATIRDPEPEKLRLAVRKQRRTLNYLRSELFEHPAFSSIQHGTLTQERESARIAVKDYLAFCNSLLYDAQDAYPK